MPQPAKGLRLWLRKGSAKERASWVIRDGAKHIRTGCDPDQREDAERMLKMYGLSLVPAPYEMLSNRLYEAKRRAKAKGVEFDITHQYLKGLGEAQEWRCALTGLHFDLSGTPRERPCVPSLDRIDSHKGYVPGNVRLVVVAMNSALGRWGEDAFVPIAKAFLAHRARRNRDGRNGTGTSGSA